jgi:DNA-binding GntR family transcriptional regulator
MDLSMNRSASQNKVQYLHRCILKGDLSPGTPSNQGDIASALGVSRSRVHDPVQLMAREPLVVTGAQQAPP